MAIFKNIIVGSGFFTFGEAMHEFNGEFQTEDKALIKHLRERLDWQEIVTKTPELTVEEKAAEERELLLKDASENLIVLENVENLSNAEIKKAISEAKYENEFAALKKEAIELQIEFQDNISFKKLKKLVDESKNDSL